MNNDEIEVPRPERLESACRIFVNQAGYQPWDEKYAVLAFPASFYTVVDEHGRICFSGATTYGGFDRGSGEVLYKADFSMLRLPGKYHVQCGSEFSMNFMIEDRAYKKCFDKCMKAFYFQRCGCELEQKYAGAWKHGKCHCAPALLFDNARIRLDVSGGWHDAGDYGRYVTAAATALAHLFYGWKMFPDIFRQQDLNIPEKPSAMPDVLLECRYELEWLLKMQRVDGSVWHKVTTFKHAPFVMPEQDEDPMYVMPISSSATADFAAVTALASTIYKENDPDLSAWLLRCSRAAWDWLEKNPQFVGFQNPKGCDTGVYGERSDRDNRFWAAAELFSATGDTSFFSRAMEFLPEEFSKTALGFASVGGFGTLALILSGRMSAQFGEYLQKTFVTRAEELANVCRSNTWGVSLTTEQYNWGSNMTVLTNGMTFLIADYLEKRAGGREQRFRRFASMQLDYILGTNPTGYSFVTGVGDFCVNYPHHRPAFADGVEECIPGLVSGGPNSRCEDPYAREMFPDDTPPMKCFSDNMECYSLNEVTIYWNSPAVFLLAGLQE